MRAFTNPSHTLPCLLFTHNTHTLFYLLSGSGWHSRCIFTISKLYDRLTFNIQRVRSLMSAQIPLLLSCHAVFQTLAVGGGLLISQCGSKCHLSHKEDCLYGWVVLTAYHCIVICKPGPLQALRCLVDKMVQFSPHGI